MVGRHRWLWLYLAVLIAGPVLLGIATASEADAVEACRSRAGQESGSAAPRLEQPAVSHGLDVAKVHGSTDDGATLWCMVRIERKWLLLVTHTVEQMTFTDAQGGRYDVDLEVAPAVS